MIFFRNVASLGERGIIVVGRWTDIENRIRPCDGRYNYTERLLRGGDVYVQITTPTKVAPKSERMATVLPNDTCCTLVKTQ